MTTRIRIVIADSQTLVRETLAKALSSVPNFEIIGEAGNNSDLLNVVASQNPSIILLGLEMPIIHDWQALNTLSVKYPSSRIVILASHFQHLLIKDLVAKGAKGFLSKQKTDLLTLIKAIQEVNHNGYFFNEEISRILVRNLLMSSPVNFNSARCALTDNEVRTLLLICDDKLTKEIASLLNTSSRSVERWKISLFEKTRTKTCAGLLMFALRNKLISFE